MKSYAWLIAVASFCFAHHAAGQTARACVAPSGMERQVHQNPTSRGYAKLAARFADQGLYVCAADSLRSAIRLDPDSARLYYLLGVLLNSAKDPTAAIEALHQASRLDPEDVKPHLALGLAFHTLNQEQDAAREWETAVRIDPASVTALDWLSKARIAEGQYAAAIVLLQNAPEDEDLTLDLVFAYSKSDQIDQAIATLQEATGKHPDSLRLCEALATLLIERHRYQQAEHSLQSLLQAHPLDEDARAMYLKVLVMTGDDEKARPLAAQLLAAHPNSFEALYLSGILARRDADYPSARRLLEAASAIAPNNFDVHYNLGAALIKLNEPEAARDHLTTAVRLDSTQPEAYFQLAAVLRALGASDQAQQMFDRYKELTRTSQMRDIAASRSAQAAMELSRGNAQHAVELYRSALEATPNNPVLLYNYALALDRSGQVAAERAALQKAIELQDAFPQALLHLAMLDADAGDTVSAEAYFRKVLTLTPNSAEADNGLGTLLIQQGKNKDAEDYFRLATESNPRFTQAWINLAATQAGAQHYDLAQKSIERALAVDASNIEALRLRELLSAETAKSH